MSRTFTHSWHGHQRQAIAYNQTMHKDLTLRFATAADAATIASHRQTMFRDNALAGDAVLLGMSEAFEPWVRERLNDHRYVGLLVEDAGRVVAGAGIFFCDFPPHWRHTEATRAYVLNVYTDPEFRGRGLAKGLMQKVLEECRNRSISTVVLHASPQGRPIYEAMGFENNDEMIFSLKLEPPSLPQGESSARTPNVIDSEIGPS